MFTGRSNFSPSLEEVQSLETPDKKDAGPLPSSVLFCVYLHQIPGRKKNNWGNSALLILVS